MTMKQRLPEKTSFLHYTANEVADNGTLFDLSPRHVGIKKHQTNTEKGVP